MRASTVQQRREEVYAALQQKASFPFLVEEWHDCEQLKPKQKAKWTFVDPHREARRQRAAWCAATSKIPLHGKEQQNEDARDEDCFLQFFFFFRTHNTIEHLLVLSHNSLHDAFSKIPQHKPTRVVNMWCFAGLECEKFGCVSENVEKRSSTDPCRQVSHAGHPTDTMSQTELCVLRDVRSNECRTLLCPLDMGTQLSRNDETMSA